MPLNPNKLALSADQKWNEALNSFPELRAKRYSDFVDYNGRQVIDLVQEGGGVLGIALVGYTYILEKAGLRVSSYAGASAGAINAAFQASINDKVYENKSESSPKSKLTLKLLATTNLSDFIDGNQFVKWLIKNAMNDYGLSKRFIIVGVALLAMLFSFDLFLFAILREILSFILNPFISNWTAGTVSAITTITLPYFIFKRLLGSKMGLNNGDSFYEWMKLNIDNQDNPSLILEDIQGTVNGNKNTIENRKIILISASVESKALVRLPNEASRYFDIKKTHPAEYVRASMSIPFFFEYFTPLNPINTTQKFIDGGLLSNFPIRELESNHPPRFPTFGVKLGLERNLNSNKESNKTPSQFISNIIGTLRGFYDTAYISENRGVKMLIKEIDTRDKTGNELNWLNFYLSDQAKEQLFNNGVDAAIQFLIDFDWEKYKNIRTGMSTK